MKLKFKISKKAARMALLSGLICSIFMSVSHFNAACDDLRTNVLRLHIIANSDSVADQELKLKIRDAILENSADLFCNAEGIGEAVSVAEGSLDRFEEIAERVIAENGFSYSAKAKIGESYFETREYEDFTLPAGEYNSVIITLGKGEGRNWWCVIFPEVCLPAAAESASLSDTVCKESAQIAEDSKRYIMKFKVVEIYEDIKKMFR